MKYGFEEIKVISNVRHFGAYQEFIFGNEVRQGGQRQDRQGGLAQRRLSKPGYAGGMLTTAGNVTVYTTQGGEFTVADATTRQDPVLGEPAARRPRPARSPTSTTASSTSCRRWAARPASGATRRGARSSAASWSASRWSDEVGRESFPAGSSSRRARAQVRASLLFQQRQPLKREEGRNERRGCKSQSWLRPAHADRSCRRRCAPRTRFRRSTRCRATTKRSRRASRGSAACARLCHGGRADGAGERGNGAT